MHKLLKLITEALAYFFITSTVSYFAQLPELHLAQFK